MSRTDVLVPAKDLERLVQLAEAGANGFSAGPARSSAIAAVRFAEALLVTATGRARAKGKL